jgi:L-iditol 2-dehydrogenase
MSPTAVSAANPIADASALKAQIQANGAAATTTKSVIDPQVLARPNLALWVNKDHK